MVHLTTALDASSGVPLYEQLYRSLAGECPPHSSR